MPTHKIKGGYRWGKHGKIYPTKAQADKQGQAIYANGWRETNENKINNINKNMAKVKITENRLKQIIMESVKRVLKESYDDEEIDYEDNYDDESSEYPESYYWYVRVFDKTKTSSIHFNSVEEAVNDCDKFLKKINFNELAAKYNSEDDFENSNVIALIESGDNEWSDTMLQNYGWGWMD